MVRFSELFENGMTLLVSAATTLVIIGSVTSVF
jgi:hypothetical protein